MKHLTEGELRASLDGELDRDQLRHLSECGECLGRQSQLRAEQEPVTRWLAFLAPQDEPAPSAKSAWARFPHQTKQKETSMLKKFFAFPVARFATVAVLAITLLMAFPTTRAMAGELLNLFRVQQVTVLPIDMSGMEDMKGNEALGNQMSELMSDATEITKEAAEPVQVANADEASESAGFDVRLPTDMTAANITVTGGSAFTFTIDRAKTQALLDSAGRGDLVLPEAGDGAEISVDISAAVSATFGTCPEMNEESFMDKSPRPSGFDPKYVDCLVFGQMPSPVVQAPASVDMAQLAQIALEFTGMSREEAAALAQTVDWTSTLVVPLPRDAATYSDVSVDGVTGSLIQTESEYTAQYVLIWVKDGVVYFVSGAGTDSARAFELVESLK
jgi:hypothetical protein